MVTHASVFSFLRTHVILAVTRSGYWLITSFSMLTRFSTLPTTKSALLDPSPTIGHPQLPQTYLMPLSPQPMNIFQPLTKRHQMQLRQLIHLEQITLLLISIIIAGIFR